MRRHLLLISLRRRRLLGLAPVPRLPRALEERHALAAALGLTTLAGGDRRLHQLPMARPVWLPLSSAVQLPAGEEELPPSASGQGAEDQPLSEGQIPAPVAGGTGEEDRNRQAAHADEEERAAPSGPFERNQPETRPPLPLGPSAGRGHLIELGRAGEPAGESAIATAGPAVPDHGLARTDQKLPLTRQLATKGTAEPKPEPANEAAQLFRPRPDEAERSPQSWLRRLVEQARREQGLPAEGHEPGTEPNRAAEPPTPAGKARESAHTAAQAPLSQASDALQGQRGAPKAQRFPAAEAGSRKGEPPALIARRFLKPLLGLDLAEVALYRDAQAAHATEVLAADALSSAAGIELAPHQAQTTPEGLGLLAHELTHVMRRHRARFLPPVVGGRPTPDLEQPAEPVLQTDEERLALAVERRVRHQARKAFAVTTPAPALQPEQATQLKPEVPAPMTATEPSAAAERSPEDQRVSQGGRGIWGSLPAPWEPLPAWLTVPTPAFGPPSSESSSDVSLSRPVGPLPPSPAESAPPPPVESEGSQRAGVERNLATPVGGKGEASPAISANRAPEPDLDALARQVYSLLKRRLSVEQRRLLS
ncbi:DUF4157 domain-containing protein [Thermogemmatispora sp.]|uniref:eCIS core domain-containing protein n=1 Tax=Thermogemmatispora sp. TaxID=1968838 RepID=UPI0035E45C7F